MPAQQSFGFEEEESLSSMLQTTGEEQKPKAIGGREMRRSRLPLQNGQLMTQERILQNRFGFGTREVLESAGPDRGLHSSQPAAEKAVEPDKTKQGERRAKRKEQRHRDLSRWAEAGAKCNMI